jgi:glycosyltransferase involved in cell wall biosynthesis
LAAHDVVFFEWASGVLAEATRLPKTAGLVARLHRYELYQWADHVNWDSVDRLIVVSRAKQAEFSARFPAQAGKVVVIPEAINLNRFTLHARPFAGDLGILCNLSPRKRVYELVLAFAELNRQQPGFRLHIGGGPHPKFPEYPEALRGLVRQLGLDGQVVFYGAVTEPDKWLAAIDVFISNSYSEGLQLAPMEAIASGCLALSHGWAGADELLAPDSLFYTDRELVEKLLAYAGAPEAERAARRAAQRQRVVECFDVDQTKVQIRHLVEAVAAERR